MTTAPQARILEKERYKLIKASGVSSLRLSVEASKVGDLQRDHQEWHGDLLLSIAKMLHNLCTSAERGRSTAEYKFFGGRSLIAKYKVLALDGSLLSS